VASLDIRKMLAKNVWTSDQVDRADQALWHALL
jgi:hypothetical protein